MLIRLPQHKESNMLLNNWTFPVTFWMLLLSFIFPPIVVGYLFVLPFRFFRIPCIILAVIWTILFFTVPKVGYHG